MKRWELTSTIEGETETPIPTVPTFTVALKPGQKTLKPTSDLSNSLPFLFESPPVPSKSPKIDDKKPQSRFFGAWRKDSGGRVPVFGPEKPVEDEYIKYAHNQQIKEILIVGAVVMLVFEAAMLAIPEIGR